MKTTAVFVTGLFLLLTLSMCAAPAEELPELEGVSITIDDPVDVSAEELDIAIANTSEMDILFGDEFRLERRKDDAWKSAGGPSEVHAVGYPVVSGEIRQHSIRLDDALKDPAPGEYRLGIPFDAMAADDAQSGIELVHGGGSVRRYIAYVTFEMKKDA